MELPRLANARVVKRSLLISNTTLARDAPELWQDDVTRGGVSINGCSVIKRPTWLKTPPDVPRGKYLMYFAHHNGKTLRLAASDRPDAGWRVRAHGVLDVSDTACEKHVGSPDVHVDGRRHRLLLYFHGCRCPGDGDKAAKAGRPDAEVPWDADHLANQRTYVAVSNDGVNFEPVTQASPQRGDASPPGLPVLPPRLGEDPLGAPYLRIFWWRSECYAIGMPGLLYRSRDPMGLGAFELGRQLPGLGGNHTRHHALRVRRKDKVLEVLFTRFGDSPERIMCVEISMADPRGWKHWMPVSPAFELLRPTVSYEGADAPLAPSVRGQAAADVLNQLRDPFILDDEHVHADGARRAWVFYSGSGEHVLAVAEVRF